ncbi:efflux transporter outer membrane subunit [Lysobacter sp. A421]
MSRSETRPLRGLKPVLLTILVSALLAGCASTHGLATHGTLLGDAELGAAGAVDPARLSAAAFPSVDWWTALGDPQLNALIAEALEGTPGLDAADARVRQAMARAGLADAARQATVGTSAQISGLQLPQAVAPESLGGDFSTVGVLTMNLAYSPELWGGKRATWQAALGRANAARVEAQAARLTLSSNIAHAYITLAQAFQIRDAAEAEQTRAAELLQLSQQRVEAGIDNQLQLRQAEGAIASARQQAQAAQQHIDAGRSAIAALLGKGPDRGRTISRPMVLDATPPPLPTVLPSELLGHRADLVAARWQVEAAARDIDASKAAFYPSINLSGLVGLVGGSLADLFSSDALLLQGGPAISLPIFDGGRLRSQLAGSNASHDLAVAQYNQRLVDALREVTDAVQAARSLDARIATATQAHKAALGASRIARTRYGAGIGTQLDVLAAGQPLLQLDQLLATLRAQQLGTMVDLNRALGGGLAPIIEPTKASTP